MKNPIKKRLPRDLRHNIVRYSSIALVFITMVSVIGGFLVAANCNKRGLDSSVEDCLREDGNFSASADVPAGVLWDVGEMGITIAPQDYYEYEYDRLFTLRIFENRTKFNLPKLHEGRLPEADDEIAVEWLYAENNNLSVGSSFSVDGKPFAVVGIIWMPDYTSPYKNNSDIIMDAAHFGVALVSSSAFDSFAKDDITHGFAYRFNNRELSDDEQFDLSNDIKKELVGRGAALTSFLTANENQAISFVFNDFGNDIPMMKGFLFAMMAILAFIFAIIIDHTITSEAGAIGALAATGMRRRELVRHYLSLPLSVTAVSAIVGSVICLTFSYKIFNDMYHSAYSLPPLGNLFDIEAILYTTVLPIAAMLLINLFFLLKRLSIMPIRFLRGELKTKKSKRGLRLPDFKFISRFRLRTILSNKGSYAMLFIGIFFANFILMLGLVLNPSIDGYIEDVERNAIAQYQYILNTPAEPPEAQQRDAEKFSVRAAEYYDAPIKQSYEVQIYGISECSKYLSDINLPSDGVVVSDSFWKKYKLSEGDEITLTDSATNETYNVTVEGSYAYSAGYAVFMPIDRMNSLADNPEEYFNGWFSDKELTLDEAVVATVITPEALRGAGEQMLTTFSELMNICLLAAVVVHLVLFVLLTKLIVDKNAHNISLMKIFGYKNKELRGIFSSTTTAVVVFSLIVSLPLTKIGITAMYTEMMFRKMSGYLDILTPWWIYAVMLALGVAVYFSVNLLNIRKIGKIPMAQALKVKE
ncbi:MAG: ABC transporter permease [Oscillospiraceae bacterium]|nr:ABC transporter permease [Oscillospiraceae bacterium]